VLKKPAHNLVSVKNCVQISKRTSKTFCTHIFLRIFKQRIRIEMPKYHYRTASPSTRLNSEFRILLLALRLTLSTFVSKLILIGKEFVMYIGICAFVWVMMFILFVYVCTWFFKHAFQASNEQDNQAEETKIIQKRDVLLSETLSHLPVSVSNTCEPSTSGGNSHKQNHLTKLRTSSTADQEHEHFMREMFDTYSDTSENLRIIFVESSVAKAGVKALHSTSDDEEEEVTIANDESVDLDDGLVESLFKKYSGSVNTSVLLNTYNSSYQMQFEPMKTKEKEEKRFS
jgi:hypothetical protein